MIKLTYDDIPYLGKRLKLWVTHQFITLNLSHKLELNLLKSI